MGRRLLAVVLSAVLCVALALPAAAVPLAYATDEKGTFGSAIDAGGKSGTEAAALAQCGGTANGCKIVMSVDGDCMAAVHASDGKGGNWYWIGYTTVENAYDLSGELDRVAGMVWRWCSDPFSGAPFNKCRIKHKACASYVRNLN